MAGNFLAFLLLLALACYVTMGGQNENLSEEQSVYEQNHGDVEYIIEELESEGENVAEVVEEEIEVATSEELVEEIPETPLECGVKKAKRFVTRESAQRCSSRSTAKAAQCPCTASLDALVETEIAQPECPVKVAKKPIRLIKRTVKKVPASTTCNSKEAEPETCSTEPLVEEVKEKVKTEVNSKQKTDKSTNVDAKIQEKTAKIQKSKQGKPASKPKNNQKSKYQNNKQTNNERGQKNKNSKNNKSNKKQSKQ